VRAEDGDDIDDLCDGFDASASPPEYFFNRGWSTFNSILDFYRLGTLHITTEVTFICHII
jgi:hypothetical protein